MFGTEITVQQFLSAIEAFEKFANQPSRGIVVDESLLGALYPYSTPRTFSIMPTNFSFKSENWMAAFCQDSTVLSESNTFYVECPVLEWSGLLPGMQATTNISINSFKSQLESYRKFNATRSFVLTFSNKIFADIPAQPNALTVCFFQGYLPDVGYCIVGACYDSAIDDPNQAIRLFEYGSKLDQIIFQSDLEPSL